MTKMPTLITYQWYGKNQQGTLLSGEFTAPNSAAVKLHLRQQGILLLKIRKKTFSLWASRRIRTTDITVFSRQLATLLVAGISFVQALELIGRSHNKPALQLLITSIKNRIEGGSGVAETLRRHPKYFNELYCNLVAIGEKTGTLDIML